MAKLIITRVSEKSNKLRKIELYLDNKKIDIIKDGEKKEFEIKRGLHTIYGKIDWCKSQKMSFIINENGSKKIKLSGYKYSKIFRRISLVFLALHFFILYVLKLDWYFLLFLAAIGPLHLIYHLTIGKNNYLVLTEVNN